MTPTFNRFYNRRSSDSIKWNLYEEDILPLWVADSDFPAPESVIQAIETRVSHGMFGYAKTQDATKIAIKDWLYRRHAWEVKIEDILLVPGVVQGFNFAAAAFTNPGDSVLIQTPAYHPFLQVAENNRLRCETHQLTQGKNGHYQISFDDFEDQITPSTRIFMLCNPQNPTGRVFQEDEIKQLAEICLRHNILICSDEIHSDLIFPGSKHIPIASLSDEVANSTVTLISASKTFNLAGLKSSAVIITNPVLRNQFQAKLRGMAGSVNIIGQTALRTAYATGEDWLTEFLLFLESNRSILVDFVSRELPGITLSPPEGTYLGWLDCSGIDLQNPADHFLKAGKVALNPGDWFGDNFNQFARINFACSTDLLQEALDRIKNCLP